MYAPKISVLIPMYNRKHYIADCIDSVLAQSFQDFEIVVRDDGSVDGSAEFVKQRYASEISSGKIKVKHNPKNLGEITTTIRLFLDACGKYFAVLHSDDMYLPDALKYLYTTAEKYSADVVHSIRFIKSPPGGVINSEMKFQLMSPEKLTVDEVTVMPDDQISRFKEFFYSSLYFGDIQYTFFRRDFILDNKVLIETRCNPLFWLLLAKVYVKTPEIYYVYRDAPDSKTRNNATSNQSLYSMKNFEESLERLIERGSLFDKYAAKIELFKKYPELLYVAKARDFNIMTLNSIKSRNYYSNGNIPPEVRQTVEKIFTKYFGINAAYPIFLFHLVNLLPYYPNFETVFLPHQKNQ